MSEVTFTAIRGAWWKMIDLALKAKKEFQQDADECMRFFNGPYDFLYGLKESPQRGDFVYVGLKRLPRPSIAMTVNKVAEAVQLFGPSLYHRNPVRTVTPRKLPEINLAIFGDPNDPQTQAMVMPMLQQMNQSMGLDTTRATLLQSYLNYIPLATDLKSEARDAIDETIIKGMGVLWQEVYTPVGSNHRLVGSFYDTIDNLVVDPDQETLQDAKWVARRRCKPVWEVESIYGLEPGTLRGNYQSSGMVAANEAIGDEFKKKQGKSNDLLVYWEIWSKMGLGGLLRGIDKSAADVDRYGQYVHLVVCEGYEFLLNMPPSIFDNDEEMRRRAQWETPFWADDGWPFEELAFHKVPRSIWPMSHFRPALGELKFLNWAFSFIASKIQRASRDFIGCLKSAGEELKTKILEGTDYELIEIEQNVGRSLDDVIKFLSHPPFHNDIWKVIEEVMELFDKRTGLTELMYGSTSHQYRSAEEANVKQNQMSIRPDDMANKVEDWMTNIARKEALMARWHLTGQDVQPVFGPSIASMWDSMVATADVNEVVHQLEYRIEAGSAKKPNKDKDMADATQLSQVLFPPLFQYGMTTGNVGPVNAFLTEFGKAMDIDVSGMLLQPPPPPPAPGAGPAGGGGPPPPAAGRNGTAKQPAMAG